MIQPAKLISILLLTGPLLSTSALACLMADRARILQENNPELDYTPVIRDVHRPVQQETTRLAAADCVAGEAGGFPCSNVRLAGHLPSSEIGGGSVADHWGWVHEPSRRKFALVGRSNGTAFVEVTDPGQPVYLGNLPRPDGVVSTQLTDIKTYAGHAFIVADNVTGQGLQVFDLSRLLTVDSGTPVSFTSDAHYTAFNEAHNVAINEDSGYAYAVGGDQCAGGLVMVDISQPTDPQAAGCFSADGHTHDVQCVIYAGPDADYQGREICFASNEDRLSVVDVTNKSSPTLLSSHFYDSGYVHQGWLTEDHRYFLLDDEADETVHNLSGTRTLTFDLSDLEQSVSPASHIANNLTYDHNQYVLGDYVFQANYQQGLRILHIDDPDTGQLSEVAYFDTYPAANGLSFVGAWSVFPFLGNGTVLVSDTNSGLFILEVTEPTVADILRADLFFDRFETP